jgi:hypothetical protein
VDDEDHEPADQRSSWKGKSVEQLVATHCVLGSRGRLNVSIPTVDDDGIDLVFNLRGKPSTLAVQVKSRFVRSRREREQSIFAAGIRRATFQARPDLALLFVLYDDLEREEIATAWLVPADEFHRATAGQSETRVTLRFVASLTGTGNQWARFRCERLELPSRIVAALEQINRDGEQLDRGAS